MRELLCAVGVVPTRVYPKSGPLRVSGVSLEFGK
ncbi:replication protein RepA4 [Salmonella enterica subsp. enterica serovar Schwarzengrund]|nr:replication protein RepA4 [Salmonella enterica subsp. enterica serovar Schwarzengrund]ECV5982886.1 replication protein RepA4 [Salmonella enterica subsp. enterica serovar Schwarzengrund]